MKTEKQKFRIRQITPEDLGVEELAKYSEQVANDDPEELARERKRVKFRLAAYGKGLFGKAFLDQIDPMVNQMSVADCKSLCYHLETKGPRALIQMVEKHQKEVDEKKKGSQPDEDVRAN